MVGPDFFCHQCQKHYKGKCPIHNDLVAPQPVPTANTHPAVWDLVIKEFQARDQFGMAKYGTRLQPFNGRDALVDAYQEALDLVVYLRTAIFERDHK